jgi:uroporphyrinogen-III synthase
VQKTLEIQVQVTPKKLSPPAINALIRIEQYDWVIFTSQNAVAFFAQELRKRKITFPQSLQVAAVGPETARTLRAKRMPVHFVPKRFTVHELLKGLPIKKGARILFPRSTIAPYDAIHALRTNGARVTALPLYTTTALPLTRRQKFDLLSGRYTRLKFKSPSGVLGLMRQLTLREKKMVRNLPAECLGPTTEEALRVSDFTHVTVKAVLY